MRGTSRTHSRARAPDACKQPAVRRIAGPALTRMPYGTDAGHRTPETVPYGMFGADSHKGWKPHNLAREVNRKTKSIVDKNLLVQAPPPSPTQNWIWVLTPDIFHREVPLVARGGFRPRLKTPFVGKRTAAVLLAHFFFPLLPVVCNIFYVGRSPKSKVLHTTEEYMEFGAIVD